MQKSLWISILGLLGLFLLGTLFAAAGAAPLAQFTPYTNIEVNMYQLNENGRSLDIRCTPGDASYGCTAFCNNFTPPVCASETVAVPYPYDTDTVTIAIETDYLLDVVPQEMSAASPWQALQAQAIAARTYAYHRIHAGYTINNSTQFQAFIPLKFESLDPALTTPFPAGTNPCQLSEVELGEYRYRICDVVGAQEYLVYGDSLEPIDAEFRAENGDPTNPCQRGQGNSCPIPPNPCPNLAEPWFDEPYLVGVDDPISTAQPRTQDDCNSAGLGQRGAMRWARGSTDAYGEGTPWPFKWEMPEQILIHYYTGINICDIYVYEDNTIEVYCPSIEDLCRWNMLKFEGLPEEVIGGQTYTMTVTLQNTSLMPWEKIVTEDGQAYFLQYRWCPEGEVCPNVWGEVPIWPFLGPPEQEITPTPDVPIWTIQPGELAVAKFEMTVPVTATLYITEWELDRYDGGSCGIQEVDIQVYPPPIPPTPTPIPTPIPPTPTPTPIPRPRWFPVEQTALRGESAEVQTSYSLLLSRVRDEVLTNNEKGKEYIALTYRYAPEMLWIFLTHDKLQQRSGALLKRFGPAIESMLGDRKAVISKDMLDEADRLLKDLAKVASPSLTGEMERWRKRLPQFAGKTVGEIWTLVSQ